MIYHTCPRCGANLDPGERCDCLREDQRENQPQTEMPPRVLPTPKAAGGKAFSTRGFTALSITDTEGKSNEN